MITPFRRPKPAQVDVPVGTEPEKPFSPELETVIVDTRPLSIILLSHSGRLATLAFGALVFATLIYLEPPAGLTVIGQRTLAVFATAVIYWVTGVLPLMVTSLLVIAALAISGVMPAKNARKNRERTW